MTSNLFNRVIQIAGSSSKDTDTQIIEFSHNLVRLITKKLLEKGAIIVSTVGKEEKAKSEQDQKRKEELLKIAEVCRWVPANAPRTFHEAVQMYWFVHLGTITELNGWDAMNPGHFDQHLTPFYEKEIAEGGRFKLDLLLKKSVRSSSKKTKRHQNWRSS